MRPDYRLSTIGAMWPFRRDDDSPETRRRLSERLKELEGEVRALRVEWEEWYDKYRRLYARISKRAEREETGSESRQDAPKPTNGHHPEGSPSRRPVRSLRGF